MTRIPNPVQSQTRKSAKKASSDTTTPRKANSCGLAIGVLIAWVLVKMMTHVFDPPPESLAIPWTYLLLLAVTRLAAISRSVILQLRKRSEPLSFAVRKL